MPSSCKHDLTEMLDSSEVVEDGFLDAVKVEACWMCGSRRAITERSGRTSVGDWERLRFRGAP